MTKEQIIEEAQKQVASFKKELDDLGNKVDGLSEDAVRLYDEQKKDLMEMLDESEKHLTALSSKASESWQDTKDFVELTNKALKHSFNYFMSHYK